MKHLQAGLIVGGIWFLTIAVAATVTAALSLVFGSALAAAIVALTVVIVIVTSFIDWFTERRGS